MPLLVSPVVDAAVFARPQPVLDAGPVTLRPWRSDDAGAVCAAYADEAVQRWHARTVETVDEAVALLDGWARTWADASGASWAVVDPGTDELVGRVALKDVDPYNGVAEVAYWTVASRRGEGNGPRAVVAAARWAFEAGFHRLELEHSTDNAPSCRVADKAGFAPEGTRRSSARHADGWHDMHVHVAFEG